MCAFNYAFKCLLINIFRYIFIFVHINLYIYRLIYIFVYINIYLFIYFNLEDYRLILETMSVCLYDLESYASGRVTSL